MLYGMSGVDDRERPTGSRLLYETMLPWLAEEPIAAAASRTMDDPACPWRTPQYSGCSHYRSLLEAFRYMLLRGSGGKDSALSPSQTKLATYFLRDAFMQMAEADLAVVKALDPHDRAVLGMASQQLALAAVKAYDSHGLDAAGLQRCRGRVASLHAAIEGKPQLDTEEAGPLLSLNNMAAGRHEAVLHPYWDRVVWQDVRGKEGAAQPIPKQMPVNFLCVPPRVTTPRQAAEALRQAERVCLLLSNLQAQETLLPRC